jgi:hypothetical protein
MLTGRLGGPGRVQHLSEAGLSKQATARARVSAGSSTSRLAKFFPEASPVRIPVRLTRMGEGRSPSSESTVIEFGTANEVLFASSLPLEFADLLHLENSDGTLDIEARVVALQYGSGGTAVAARFTQAVSNWIVQPELHSRE